MITCFVNVETKALKPPMHTMRNWLLNPRTRPQALAWLRCKVEQTKAALAAAPSGAYAGMDAGALTSYAAGGFRVDGLWI